MIINRIPIITTNAMFIATYVFCIIIQRKMIYQICFTNPDIFSIICWLFFHKNINFIGRQMAGIVYYIGMICSGFICCKLLRSGTFYLFSITIPLNLVCRLLLEKKNNQTNSTNESVCQGLYSSSIGCSTIFNLQMISFNCAVIFSNLCIIVPTCFGG